MTVTKIKTRYPHVTKWVEPGKPNRWFAKLAVTDPGTGKRRYPEKMCGSEAEAKAFVTTVLEGVTAGVPAAPVDVRTVADAVAAFMRMKGKLADSTREGYEAQFGYLLADHRELAITAIDVELLLNLRDKLRTEGAMRKDGRQGAPLSSTSANYCIKVIGMMLRMEFRQGNIPMVPTDLMGGVEDNDTAERPTFTREQCDHLFAKTQFDRFRVAYRLGLYGLRRGEIAGLRRTDIDLVNKRLSISETRIIVRGKVVVKKPTANKSGTKTKAGTRTLPISDKLAADLAGLLGAIETEKALLGEFYRDSGYLLVDESGVAFSPTVIADRWDRMLVQVGLPAIHFHDARHTCVTLMRLEKVPAPVIAKWVGHAKLAMTEHYSHSQDGALDLVAESDAANL